MLSIFPSRRRRKGKDPANTSGGGAIPNPSGELTAPSSHNCESCRSAPGIPFCRVEWSFLCSGCAAVVHGHNWVVSVSPNPNPSPNSPYPYPFFCPYPNPNSDPNLVVQLSSGDEGGDGCKKGKRGRKLGVSYGRMECVMRYREKRKSRRYEKTVRYENPKVNEELRPRVDGKFSRREDGGGRGSDEVRSDCGEEVWPDENEALRPYQNEELGPDRNEELWLNVGEELRQRDGEEQMKHMDEEEVRLQ